jgi:hypothetical protein
LSRDFFEKHFFIFLSKYLFFLKNCHQGTKVQRLLSVKTLTFSMAFKIYQ